MGQTIFFLFFLPHARDKTKRICFYMLGSSIFIICLLPSIYMYLPVMITLKLHSATFPALSVTVKVTLCSPQVNSLPFGQLGIMENTPTLSDVVSPGKKIVLSFFPVERKISSGQEMTGGSTSVFGAQKNRQKKK